jgi:prepilin-type N-terminal cleavage/methylation domain-containing protein
MKSCVRKLSRAFTLLEIMIALGLLSLIIIAIYSSWFSIIKGAKVAGDAAAAAQRTRIAMRTVQDSLLCACMYSQNIKYYAFLADSDGDYASLSFVAHLPSSFPHSGIFAGGDLNVRRLNFTVEDGPNSQKQLVLRQRPVLMQEMDKDELNHPLVLAKHVKLFIVEYTDPKTGDWVKEWKSTNQLPHKVRITIGLGELDQFSSKPQESLIGTVALAAQPVRLDWQMPGGLQNGPIPGQTNTAPPKGSNIPATPGNLRGNNLLGNGSGP